MIVPNTKRVLLKRLTGKEVEGNILLPGQMKAGENLFVGEIIHPGESQFTKGQVVYYSEYSAAQIMDMGAVMRKELTLGDVSGDKNAMFIVAEDDIMAYDEPTKPTKT